jgi:hypothetical protein
MTMRPKRVAMQLRPRHLAMLVGGVWFAASTAVACGDDQRPAVTGSSSASSSSSSSSGGAASDAGDSATPPETDLCGTLEQLSRVVGEQNIPDVPPQPSGGALVPGVYVLNELKAFAAPSGSDGGDAPALGPTGNYGRATLTVTSGSLRFVESSGTDPDELPADTQRILTYVPSGTTLRVTQACGTAASSSAIGYSVEETYITFHTDERRAAVFRRKP